MDTSERNIVAAQIQKQLDIVHRVLGIEKPKDDLALRLEREQETVSQSSKENKRFDKEPTGQQSAYEDQRKHSFIKTYADSEARFVESRASFVKAQARFNHQMSGRYKKD